MADPLSNVDVATENYVDKKAITTAGGVVSGGIQKFNVGSDLVRSLGCSYLTVGTKFKLSVGSDLVRSLSCNDLTTGKKFTNSAGDRYKYAIVFLSRFTITCAYQDKN